MIDGPAKYSRNTENPVYEAPPLYNVKLHKEMKEHFNLFDPGNTGEVYEVHSGAYNSYKGAPGANTDSYSKNNPCYGSTPDWSDPQLVNQISGEGSLYVSAAEIRAAQQHASNPDVIDYRNPENLDQGEYDNPNYSQESGSGDPPVYMIMTNPNSTGEMIPAQSVSAAGLVRDMQKAQTAAEGSGQNKQDRQEPDKPTRSP